MVDYYLRLKTYYENLKSRERWFAALLGWALIYVIFDVFLYNPVTTKIGKLIGDQQIMEKQIGVWDTQLAALNQLERTPQYQQWLAQKQAAEKLQAKYNLLRGGSETSHWHALVTNILRNYKDVSLVSIVGTDEQTVQTNEAAAKTNMFQQRVTLTIYGNYFNTIQYLQSLEEGLGNVKWVGLNYSVVQYPVAKVEVELGILYEKNPA